MALPSLSDTQGTAPQLHSASYSSAATQTADDRKKKHLYLRHAFFFLYFDFRHPTRVRLSYTLKDVG